MKRSIFGLIVIGVGVIMVLNAMGIHCFEWLQDYEWRKFIVPGIVILVGLRILFHRNCCNKTKNLTDMEIPESNGNEVKISVAFAGNNYNYNGQTFNGAKVDALLGGVKLDLREAILPEKCMINVHTCMGGVEIMVPKDANIIVDSNCLLGGVDNKHANNISSSTSKTIIVKANCMLGGVDIKD